MAARKSRGEVNMRLNTMVPSLTPKYAIDFALVPAAIILIEFSVFITQLSNGTSISLPNLIFTRIIHTVLMVLTSQLVSQAFIRNKKTEVKFRTLAITGIVVMAFGDLTHSLLAATFDIELVSLYRRIGIILIQGGLWFPAFIIIGGNRKEILHQFKDYVNRLIVVTRSRSRTSPEFKEIQRNIQDQIKNEFYAACASLKELIKNEVNSGQSLSQQYAAIKPNLVGENLRNLSRKLESTTTSNSGKSLVDKNGNKVLFFIQEFSHLYGSITRSSPLQASSYALVLIALSTPLLINFYSVMQFLITYPILVITVFALAQLVVKAQSGFSYAPLRTGSILVIFTGLLPYVFSLAGQTVNFGPEEPFPTLVGVIALPLTYFVCMEVFQVLRPSALSLVRNDKLIASDALQNKVKEVAIDDFSKYLYQQWAVFIHGKILTRLAATSLKLQVAARTEDTQSFNATLQSLFNLLSTPDADFEEESTDLETEVTSRLVHWRGLLQINVHINQELKSLRSERVKNVGEVIEELISNSNRHGKAKKIDLRIVRSEGNNIEIIAIDNALIPPANPPVKLGLGTRIFNLVSDGRWYIKRVGLFTEFKLTMTME